VLEVSEGKPIRIWGVYDGGVRALAELEPEPLSFEPSADGRFFFEAVNRLGWYELVNLEDAWEAGRRDTSGEHYPPVVLAPKPPEQDDDGEDNGEDDDNDDDGDPEDVE
jgi:hypothetical protein